MNYLKHKNQLYLMQLVEEKNNKMGGNMKYTEKDLETIDQEIALLNSKLVELQQKRSLIKTSLLDSAISERTEEISIKKSDDISKEEFVTRIKQLFHQSSTATSNSIEEQIYNKLILLIIERNIVDSIYTYENYDKKPEAETEQDFELEMTDMVFNRSALTKGLLTKLCNPNNWTADSYSEFMSYNDILDKLVNDPNSIGYSNGRIKKGNNDVFDYETAKKLYDELLVPYYISLHFPTKKDGNNNDVPFAFCLEDFESFRPTENRIAKVTKHYMDNGVPSNVVEKMLQRQYTTDGVVRMAPEEVILMEQYREEMSKGHLKR